jgi:uncharacterized protein (TIGR00251 family)
LVKILVQVHPGAKKNQVLRFESSIWHLKIAAPPVEGKANKELIEFLSEVLGIAKSHILIEKGATSHKKLVMIEGLTEKELASKLKQTFNVT